MEPILKNQHYIASGTEGREMIFFFFNLGSLKNFFISPHVTKSLAKIKMALHTLSNMT